MSGANDIRARGLVSVGGLRTALLASAAAVLPIVALSLPTASAQASAPAALAPSGEPMVLTRVLRRPLPGGAEVSTARSYEIRFVRENQGYRIEGELIDVRVAVPPAYEALATIERSRPDQGMFPMRLDSRGHFVAADGTRPQVRAHKASQVALSQVPVGLANSEARDARAFIAQIGSNPVHTAWPSDLFMPMPGKRADNHVVPLPGGKTGEVAIEIEANVDAVSGMLTMLKRHVTTRLGDSTRITEEVWTLARKD